MRTAFGIARIIAAVTAVVALIGDINFTIGTGPFATANFFSYFTVQSMMLAVVVLVVGAINALVFARDPVWLDIARVLSTSYVIVSGIVFAAILVEGSTRGIPVWAPWSSQLLHFWIPAYMLIDWIVAPGRVVPWKSTAWVMIFPALWVIYTMIRGAHEYWYPYFFLDPALVEIPWELSLYLLIVVAIFTGTVTLLLAISRHRLRLRVRRRARQQIPRSETVRG